MAHEVLKKHLTFCRDGRRSISVDLDNLGEPEADKADAQAEAI